MDFLSFFFDVDSARDAPHSLLRVLGSATQQASCTPPDMSGRMRTLSGRVKHDIDCYFRSQLFASIFVHVLSLAMTSRKSWKQDAVLRNVSLFDSRHTVGCEVDLRIYFCWKQLKAEQRVAHVITLSEIIQVAWLQTFSRHDFRVLLFVTKFPMTLVWCKTMKIRLLCFFKKVSL